MEERPIPGKGARKGNRNAVKHGFYTRIFDEAEKPDFTFAIGIEGIDEEIALLRMEIKKAITGGDARNLILLVKAAGALERLVRTRYQIGAAQRRGLKEAIGNVIKDVLLPLGVNIGGAIVGKKITVNLT
jgi:hypothetical protein